MPIFTAEGGVAITYFNADDEVIGHDTAHNAYFEIEAESIEEAMAAPLIDWEPTGSNGTIGREMMPGYTWDDVAYEEDELVDLINITPEDF